MILLVSTNLPPSLFFYIYKISYVVISAGFLQNLYFINISKNYFIPLNYTIFLLSPSLKATISFTLLNIFSVTFHLSGQFNTTIMISQSL